MEKISGLSKIGRERLTQIYRNTKGIISVADAAAILGISRSDASKMLSRWVKKGWLSRIRRGMYIPIPFDSYTTDITLEDPWVIIDRLFSPCYIGGWSAAEYWDLTEQIFNTIFVMTVQKPKNRNQTIKGTRIILRTIQKKAIFGLKAVWKGQTKVSISDPARTIIDMLIDPKIGGGIRPTVDMLKQYLNSDKSNIDLLVQYAKQLNKGSVFKRLGFLLERFAPNKKQAINTCLAQLTKGNAKLDPNLTSDKLITRWRLWVPDNWKNNNV